MADTRRIFISLWNVSSWQEMEISAAVSEHRICDWQLEGLSAATRQPTRSSDFGLNDSVRWYSRSCKLLLSGWADWATAVIHRIGQTTNPSSILQTWGCLGMILSGGAVFLRRGIDSPNFWPITKHCSGHDSCCKVQAKKAAIWKHASNTSLR